MKFLAYIMLILMPLSFFGCGGTKKNEQHKPAAAASFNDSLRADSLRLDSLRLDSLAREQARLDSLRLDSIEKAETFIKALPEPQKLLSHAKMMKVADYLKSIGYQGDAHYDPEGDGYSNGTYFLELDTLRSCTVKWNENHPNLTVRVSISGDSAILSNYFENARQHTPGTNVSLRLNTVTIQSESKQPLSTVDF